MKERQRKIATLQDGQLVVMSFLRVDISGHTRIALNNPQRNVANTLDAFEDLVRDKAAQQGGEVWHWSGDGGLCVFCSDDITEMCEQGVNCANSILEALAEFNKGVSSIPEELQVRMAVHVGEARVRNRKGSIHSHAINFVSHLEADETKTPSNSCSISQEVYRELSGSVKDAFRPNGPLEGRAVYGNQPTPGRLQPLIAQGSSQGYVQEVIVSVDVADVRAGEQVIVAVSAKGLRNVKQLDITLALSPLQVFLPKESVFECLPNFLTPGIELPDATRVRSGGATFGEPISGDSLLGTFGLPISKDIRSFVQAQIIVERISVGPSSTERTEVFGVEAGLIIPVRINPS